MWTAGGRAGSSTSNRCLLSGRRSCCATRRAENEFDPIAFDVEAARIYGRVTAAVIGSGRLPRRRVADLMIAAVAVAEDLPLFTTNPDEFVGLAGLLAVVPVTRPELSVP